MGGVSIPHSRHLSRMSLITAATPFDVFLINHIFAREASEGKTASGEIFSNRICALEKSFSAWHSADLHRKSSSLHAFISPMAALNSRATASASSTNGSLGLEGLLAPPSMKVQSDIKKATSQDNVRVLGTTATTSRPPSTGFGGNLLATGTLFDGFPRLPGESMAESAKARSRSFAHHAASRAFGSETRLEPGGDDPFLLDGLDIFLAGLASRPATLLTRGLQMSTTW